LFITVKLPVVGFAQTDDAQRDDSLRENDAVKPRSDRRIADLAHFAIVMTVVDTRHRSRPVDLPREFERYTVAPSVGFVLCRIKNNFDVHYCSYTKVNRQVAFASDTAPHVACPSTGSCCRR
jgi:hypothetical protein